MANLRQVVTLSAHTNTWLLSFNFTADEREQKRKLCPGRFRDPEGKFEAAAEFSRWFLYLSMESARRTPRAATLTTTSLRQSPQDTSASGTQNTRSGAACSSTGNGTSHQIYL